MKNIIRRIIYKIFKGIVIEELLKDIHKKHIKEQEEIINAYVECDWESLNQHYDEANAYDWDKDYKEYLNNQEKEYQEYINGQSISL
jgi:HEPN domain-containing protein